MALTPAPKPKKSSPPPGAVGAGAWAGAATAGEGPAPGARSLMRPPAPGAGSLPSVPDAGAVDAAGFRSTAPPTFTCIMGRQKGGRWRCDACASACQSTFVCACALCAESGRTLIVIFSPAFNEKSSDGPKSSKPPLDVSVSLQTCVWEGHGGVCAGVRLRHRRHARALMRFATIMDCRCQLPLLE